MPEYEEYRKSISNELISIRNRVRNFVRQWPEDGRYKENILKSVLIKHLPKTVSVATGFVIGDDDRPSSQIDIIIYDNSIPPIFCLDDFVIVVKESVRGIIEVKTTIKNDEFEGALLKADENGRLIGNHIFNGVFGYETAFKTNRHALPEKVETPLRQYSGYVNNIAFGEDIFMKYWKADLPTASSLRIPPNNPHYSFYSLKKLAFGYFISNLIEDVYIQCNRSTIPDTLERALYPIEGTKQRFLIEKFEIVLN